MKHMLKTLRFAAVLLLVTLVAAACNPDSGSGGTAGGADTGVVGANDTVPAESPAESPEPAPAPEAEATEDAPAATESEDAAAAAGDADAEAASDTEATEETPASDDTENTEDTEDTDDGEDAANADDTDDTDDADETADAAAGECFVHLYDGDDFDADDDNFRLEEPGRYGDLADLPDADKDWDDEADSMQVGAGARVTTWSEADFGGDSTDYGPGNHAGLDPAPRSLELTCE